MIIENTWIGLATNDALSYRDTLKVSVGKSSSMFDFQAAIPFADNGKISFFVS